MRKKSNSGTLNRYKMTFYRTQKELRTPSEADEDNFRGKFKVLDKIEVRFAKEWEHMTDKGGVKFSCTVEDALQLFEDELSPAVKELIEDTAKITHVMDSFDPAKTFFTKTIEGQNLLEQMVSEYTDWDETLLDIPPITANSDIVSAKEIVRKFNMSLLDAERWEQEEDELDRFVSNQNPLDEPITVSITEEVHTYCIRLLDEDWNHWLYIGKSKNIFNALKNHVGQGGTFKESNKRRMEVIKIEELATGNKKESFLQKYKEESDVPETHVCGLVR